MAVCAYVNWPTRVKPRNPADVLPHCYRDSASHFYLWRNRWQDANDTVITVLLTRTKGYMESKPDRVFRINTMGKHLSWGPPERVCRSIGRIRQGVRPAR